MLVPRVARGGRRVDAAYGPLSEPVPLPVFGVPGSPPPTTYTRPPALEVVDRRIPRCRGEPQLLSARTQWCHVGLARGASIGLSFVERKPVITLEQRQSDSNRLARCTEHRGFGRYYERLQPAGPRQRQSKPSCYISAFLSSDSTGRRWFLCCPPRLGCESEHGGSRKLARRKRRLRGRACWDWRSGA